MVFSVVREKAMEVTPPDSWFGLVPALAHVNSLRLVLNPEMWIRTLLTPFGRPGVEIEG